MRYVSFSGGADSTAMAIIYKEVGEEFELLFSDTGDELPENLIHVHKVASALDVKLRVVSNGSFYQHLANFGFLLPSHTRRWCTRLLKIAPLDAHLKDGDIIAIGFRVDEQDRVERVRKNYNCKVEFPLIDMGMDKKKVFELCKKHDLLNPVYSWRSSVSCVSCPFQRIRDWKNLLHEHPNLYAVAENWEEQGAYNWRSDLSLAQIRKLEREQIDMFRDDYDEPCLICR